MFFPLFSEASTDILRIYELSKILNKIPCQTLVLTMIFYNANSVLQLHLAFERYTS